MIRSAAGVLLGIVMAGAVIAFSEAIPHLLVGPSAGLAAGDHPTLSASLASVSVGPLLLALGAWSFGTFVGAGVAALMARHARTVCAVLVGCAVMAAGTLNVVTLAHPTWVWVVVLAVVVPTAWLAGRLASPSPVR